MNALEGLTIRTQVECLIASLPRAECRSCECLLGYLAQLEVDGHGKAGDRIAAYGRPDEPIHSCLGCDPCPPADALVAYLQSRDEKVSSCCE